MRVIVIAVGAILLAFGASACGESAPSQTAASAPQHACPRARREWRRAWHDIGVIRAGARTDDKAKVRHGTIVFLDDLAASRAIGLKAKNRLIDHAAAAAVAGGCDQCFQQLEAVRPIPALAHGSRFRFAC